MRPQNDLQSALLLAEENAQALSRAVLSGQADLVEHAARGLQQAAQVLSDGLRGLQPGTRSAPALALQRRLRKISQTLQMQREACARRAAMVEMSLNCIVPATRSSTYSGASAYGHGARQTGAFKLLSA